MTQGHVTRRNSPDTMVVTEHKTPLNTIIRRAKSTQFITLLEPAPDAVETKPGNSMTVRRANNFLIQQT